MVYRLSGRTFSRLWRRNKKYSNHEIKWLAKRRRLTVETHGTQIKVTDPVRKKVVAIFNEVTETKERDEKPDEKIQAFAAIKATAPGTAQSGHWLAGVADSVKAFCGLHI